MVYILVVHKSIVDFEKEGAGLFYSGSQTKHLGLDFNSGVVRDVLHAKTSNFLLLYTASSGDSLCKTVSASSLARENHFESL